MNDIEERFVISKDMLPESQIKEFHDWMIDAYPGVETSVSENEFEDGGFYIDGVFRESSFLCEFKQGW